MRRILLVDHDFELAETAARRLADELDVEVVRAHTKQEGLTHVAGGHTFDLLVTAWRLPDGCGVEVMMRAHASRADLPIILCSETADKDVLLLAVAAGATYCLLKPFDLDVLLAKVRTVLEKMPAPLYHDERLA